MHRFVPGCCEKIKLDTGTAHIDLYCKSLKLTTEFMRKLHPIFLCLFVLFIFSSCEKTHHSYTSAGGQLPGHNIVIKDSSFFPASLTVVAGSTISFLNQTGSPHTIMSDDSIAIKPIVIAPGSYYTFKSAYSGIVPFHCADHPSARGVLIISP